MEKEESKSRIEKRREEIEKKRKDEIINSIINSVFDKKQSSRTRQRESYTADARNNQKAEAGASTYCPSTTPNFKFCSKNCVSTKRTASVTSANNITRSPEKVVEK